MSNTKKAAHRKIIITEDGSHSFFVPELDETYHSIHGARQEAEHIFVKAALQYAYSNQDSLNILELGFGTGLNAYLSLKFANQNQVSISYYGIEKYPITWDECQLLNYHKDDDASIKEYFVKLHQVEWEHDINISPWFRLTKIESDFRTMKLQKDFFDIVYFDAFGPDVQADLWIEPVFKLIFDAMCSGGVLTTYSVKGSIRRAMKAVGFTVEKIPGPLGKREISRAIKP